MDGIIAVNGEYFDPKSASIPALDRGFLFGDNVFEVFVGFKDKVLDLGPHLSRLRQSAELLHLPIPWSDEELKFELLSLAERLDMPKIYLRLVVTRGSGVGLELPNPCVPHKIIYGLPANSLPEKVYREGVRLRLFELPHTERTAMAKTGNYLRSILAMEKAKKEGFSDVMWNNSAGEITEASTANIFFIGRQGDYVTVTTPSVKSGILKGITRATVLSLLQKARIPVEESIIYKDELAKYDEAFLCSTVKGLVPLAQINSHQFHTVRNNSIFKHINRLYQSWVASEIGYYVDWNTGVRVAPPAAD
ncbi:MAG: aminotransferase class IV [Oligoflexales bacterium]|nr:aminotransferase class IV [Oligoflexales bacterium]